MKKTLLNILKTIVRLTLIALAIFTIVAIVRSYEADKWSKLVDETRALIPVVSTEKNEDIIKRVCDEEGVPWIQCILVAQCESRFDKFFKEKMRQGYDRGIFAINSYHYKQVSDDCAFDVGCSARIFTKAYKTGRASDWLCYRTLGF